MGGGGLVGWCWVDVDGMVITFIGLFGQFSSSSPVGHSEGPGEIKRREVVLDPQLTGSRRNQEEGGGAGPCS